MNLETTPTVPPPADAAVTQRTLRPFGARWIALAAATLITLYLCWLMLAPFVDVLLWAGVLAIVAWPLHRAYLRRTGKPALAAAITTMLVVLIVLIPLSLITLMVVREARVAARELPGAAKRFLDPNSPAMQWAGKYVDVQQYLSAEFVAEHMETLSRAMASRTLGVVGDVLGVVIQIFFVLFVLFYLLRDRARIVEALYEVMPLSRAQAEKIFARTEEVISASVYGVLVISAIQGLLGAIAFWALGLQSPLLWGVVMFLLSMIPMAGAFIVWGPAALILLIGGHWIKALILTAWGVLVIGMIDNVLRPRLVGEKTKLHELLIFFSVLGGLQVFGVLGLVVGPVVLALALALLDVVREMDRERTMPVVAAGLPGAGSGEVVKASHEVPLVVSSSPQKSDVSRPAKPDSDDAPRGGRRGRNRGR